MNVGIPRLESTKQKLRAARLADGHFPKAENGRPYWEGKTGENHPKWKGGLTPERQDFYSSGEWKNVCKFIWRRSDAKCERCALDHRLIDRNQVRFHIHHMISFQVREFRAAPNNLVLLCAPCHHFVHSNKNATKQFIGEVA